jgi:hypothetical protein
MFVKNLSTDLWGGPADVEDEDVPAPSWQQIETAIRALDGKRRTMVTLGADGESHLAVGGGSSNRYVVYMTFDNMHFLNLCPTCVEAIEDTGGLATGRRQKP